MLEDEGAGDDELSDDELATLLETVTDDATELLDNARLDAIALDCWLLAIDDNRGGLDDRLLAAVLDKILEAASELTGVSLWAVELTAPGADDATATELAVIITTDALLDDSCRTLEGASDEERFASDALLTAGAVEAIEDVVTLLFIEDASRLLGVVAEDSAVLDENIVAEESTAAELGAGDELSPPQAANARDNTAAMLATAFVENVFIYKLLSTHYSPRR